MSLTRKPATIYQIIFGIDLNPEGLYNNIHRFINEYQLIFKKIIVQVALANKRYILLVKHTELFRGIKQRISKYFSPNPEQNFKPERLHIMQNTFFKRKRKSKLDFVLELPEAFYEIEEIKIEEIETIKISSQKTEILFSDIKNDRKNNDNSEIQSSTDKISDTKFRNINPTCRGLSDENPTCRGLKNQNNLNFSEENTATLNESLEFSDIYIININFFNTNFILNKNISFLNSNPMNETFFIDSS